VTARELRLRHRIDQLSDDRDQALAQLADCRRQHGKLRRRIYQLKTSRALWRNRAKQWAGRRP
jgi:hypothetical protein